MTNLQLTPEGPPPGTPEEPPPGTPEDPDVAPKIEAPGAEGSPDELRLAEAERLERYEVERAAGEGMTGSPEEAAEAELAAGEAPHDRERMNNPGFDEAR
jgi:hypothetical protein